MTTSSGYLRDGSKSAGLIRMPSIAAPSFDFHCTTSRLPSGNHILRGDVGEVFGAKQEVEETRLREIVGRRSTPAMVR